MCKKLMIASLLAMAASVAHADWKKDLKGQAKSQAGSQAEQRLGLPISAPAGTSVYFINLKDGATVTSPVLIQFGLKAAGVSPPGTKIEGTGHHVLLVDDPQVDYTQALPVTTGIQHFDKGQTETSLSLSPGKHTLQLVFADWKQFGFNPAVQSEKVTVTVSGAAAAPATR